MCFCPPSCNLRLYSTGESTPRAGYERESSISVFSVVYFNKDRADRARDYDYVHKRPRLGGPARRRIAANVPDPTATEVVKLALKEMGRSVSARQKQARRLVWAEIKVFLEFEPRGLRDVRDRALVAVAYDTMCRREELVNLKD